MSYELIAILMVLVFAVAGFAATLVTVVHGFREIGRIQRAIAGLVVQESEKVQQLLRA